MKTLQLMNFGFEKLGEIAQYESLQLTRSYCGTGSLSLTIDPRAKNAELLVPDVIVFFGDEPEKAFLTEDISSYTRTKLTVKGCMLKGLAKRRVCVPPAAGERPYQDFGWDRFTGSAEAAYLHFAENNLISPDNAVRAIPNLVLAANLDRGDVLPWQARFDRLDTVFQSIGDTTEMGWDIVPDISAKQFIFHAWAGQDRTQGDTLCLISEGNGNAADITCKQTNSGSASTVYAGGAGEDENRFILSVGGAAHGVSRRELWSEAGSLEEPDLLTLYAQNKLTDSQPKVTLSAGLIDSGACRYGRDYDVGDRVLVSGRGAYMAARIAEITETYENGVRTLKARSGTRRLRWGKCSPAGRAPPDKEWFTWHRRSTVSFRARRKTPGAMIPPTWRRRCTRWHPTVWPTLVPTCR